MDVANHIAVIRGERQLLAAAARSGRIADLDLTMRHRGDDSPIGIDGDAGLLDTWRHRDRLRW